MKEAEEQMEKGTECQRVAMGVWQPQVMAEQDLVPQNLRSVRTVSLPYDKPIRRPRKRQKKKAQS